MNNWSEIIEIIEGGLENNPKKVRAYTKLLLQKLEQESLPENQNMIAMLKARLDGTYKDQPLVVALAETKESPELIMEVDDLLYRISLHIELQKAHDKFHESYDATK